MSKIITRASNVFIPGIFIILLAGCSSFDSADARELVAQVGAERIRIAANSLRAQKGKLPANKWPSALQKLAPERIYIDNDGVHIVKRSFFVQEEGIFILFKGATPPPVTAGGDPDFKLITEGIYWYLFAG